MKYCLKLKNCIVHLLLFLVLISGFFGYQKYTIRAKAESHKPVPSPTAFAHALGGVDGINYTNSEEAFLQSYEKGFRTFEADFSLTSDGGIVLWHSWSKNQINSETEPGYIPTKAEFAEMKIHDRYNSLTCEDLLLLMKEYDDVYLITDTKSQNPEASAMGFMEIERIARSLGVEDVLDRFVIQVYNKEMYRCISKACNFSHYAFTIYKKFDEAPSGIQFYEIADFCSENEIGMIVMPKEWWHPGYMKIADSHNVNIAVHTVNSELEAKALYDAGVHAIYTDYLDHSGEKA